MGNERDGRKGEGEYVVMTWIYSSDLERGLDTSDERRETA